MEDANDNICVKETGRTGKSLFARRRFEKGDVVLVIAGPIIDGDTIYSFPIARDLYIDLVPFDHPGRYLCHSCDPNLGIKQRTLVVAMRGIDDGEEVTIDYAMIVDAYGDYTDPDNLVCKCGSEACRGEVGSWSKLPQPLRAKYQGFVSEFLL